MRRTRATALLVPAFALALSACGGASSSYCTTLTDNPDVSATVFGTVAPGQANASQIDARLELLGQVEDDVHGDLQQDFDTWTAYLEEVGPLLEEGDPAAVLEAATDEVDAARESLFDHFTGTCMA